MTAKRLPTAPAHLASPTRAWWRAVVEAYALEPHHLRLLQLAGESWDRCQQARAVLDREGLTYDNAGRPATRPEIAIERDSRLAFARIVRELDLDTDGLATERTRPPSIRSNRRP
jgi:phage terminase small subunit